MNNTPTRHISFAAVLVSLTAACGGSNDNTQPQNPSTTTTTSYTAPTATGTQSDISPTATGATSTPSSASTTTTSEPSSTAPMSPTGTSATQTNGATTDTSMAPAAGTSATNVTDSAVVSDAQVAAVLDAVNRGEADQARVALKKAKSSRVKTYAAHVIADHERTESELRSLESKDGLTPLEGPLSNQLKDGSDRLLATLRSKTGDELDRAYIDAQVEQHAKVLDDLDRFLAQTRSSDMKTLLERARRVVSEHLTEAKSIQAELTK